MLSESSSALGPTYEEMLHPHRMPAHLRSAALRAAQEDPLDRANLFNITWRDASGRPYYDVLPSALTGVEAPIVVLYGCELPSGSHKVGAAYAVLAERALEGDLIPGQHICVWPSTGNYGIGGAWVGGRLGFESVVIMPEGMSQERFDRIRAYGARVVTTPGSESDVDQVYRRCGELLGRDPAHICMLDQFSAMANYRFHYHVTGNTVVELAADLQAGGVGAGRIAAFVSAMGSGGTIAAGDRIKQVWPASRTVGLEPIQCPTLICNGYGRHGIQGIGDRQVTWIHNVMAMDAMMALDDVECQQGLQLLAEEAGWEAMTQRFGIPEEVVRRMSTRFGVSGVCNVLGAIKTAKFYHLGRDDVIVTVCTDGIDRYRSVLRELNARYGPMDRVEATARLVSIFHRQKTDWVQEGTIERRHAWHQLKFFTWVEQRGKSWEELDALGSAAYWEEQQALIEEVDAAILAARSR